MSFFRERSVCHLCSLNFLRILLNLLSFLDPETHFVFSQILCQPLGVLSSSFLTISSPFFNAFYKSQLPVWCYSAVSGDNVQINKVICRQTRGRRRQTTEETYCYLTDDWLLWVNVVGNIWDHFINNIHNKVRDSYLYPCIQELDFIRRKRGGAQVVEKRFTCK